MVLISNTFELEGGGGPGHRTGGGGILASDWRGGDLGIRLEEGGSWHRTGEGEIWALDWRGEGDLGIGLEEGDLGIGLERGRFGH